MAGTKSNLKMRAESSQYFPHFFCSIEWCPDSISCPLKPTPAPTSFHPTLPTLTPTTTSPVTQPSTSSKTTGGLHGAALAAVVFGAIVVCLCCVVLWGIYFVKYRRSGPESELVPLKTSENKFGNNNVATSKPKPRSQIKLEEPPAPNLTQTELENNFEIRRSDISGDSAPNNTTLPRQAQNLKAFFNMTKEVQDNWIIKIHTSNFVFFCHSKINPNLKFSKFKKLGFISWYSSFVQNWLFFFNWRLSSRVFELHLEVVDCWFPISLYVGDGYWGCHYKILAIQCWT